jgi:hypothetical protein
VSEAEDRVREWIGFWRSHPELEGGVMTEPEILPVLDEPPRNYVDPHDVLADLSEEEMAEGERLRQQIDPDDDEDNGL